MTAVAVDADRYGLGGADIAAVLGVSPYESTFSVWAKASGLLADEPPTARMRVGSALEGAIPQLFTEDTGLYVAGEQMVLRHRRARWARGHVDGLVFDGRVDEPSVDLALGGAEWKTDARPPWDEIPDHIEAQCRWYMALSGLERWWLGVLHGRFEFRVYLVERDRRLEGRMVRAAGYLWHRHVLTGVPPRVDGLEATTAALKVMWPTHDPGSVLDLDEEGYTAVEDWTWARLQRQAAEKLEDERANTVRVLMGDAETARYGGLRLCTYKTQARSGFDVKALRADHPDLAEQYTTRTTTRVLRAHEKE